MGLVSFLAESGCAAVCAIRILLATVGASAAWMFGRARRRAHGRRSKKFECDTRFVYGLCMATKTISIETDAYDLLAKEKKDHTESFSRVIRRLFAERPALAGGQLLDVMQEFKGRGAGPRRS